jgi:hypothetical protein
MKSKYMLYIDLYIKYSITLSLIGECYDMNI